jgi:hypothetical protein
MKLKEENILKEVERLRGMDLTVWPCQVKGCDKNAFITHQARNNHYASAHPGVPWPKMGQLEFLARRRIKAADAKTARIQARLARQAEIKKPKDHPNAKNWPSNQPKYRSENYGRLKMKRYSLGHTAQDKEFADPAMVNHVIEIARQAGWVNGEYIGGEVSDRKSVLVMPAKHGHIGPAGRKRLSDSMKKRWAIKKRMDRNHRPGIHTYRAPFEFPLPECPYCHEEFPNNVIVRIER